MANIAETYPAAFTQGRTIEHSGQTYTSSVITVGRVSLPSGRIVACDLLTSADCSPFVQTVLPGRYAVDLALTRSAGSGERVTMARIQFTSRRPTVWVMALRRGEDPQTLAPGAYFGYKTESGTGAFMDAEAVTQVDFAHLDDIDPLLAALTENYRPHRYWMEYPVDRRLNAVMYSCGAGAGFYASYFGIDDAGDVCTLVTDFNLAP